MTSGVLVVDTVSRITLVNKEAATILGRSAQELVGGLLMEHPELSELFRLINRIRSTRPLYDRSPQQYEVSIQSFQGIQIPLGVSINALLDAKAGVLGYVAICKDLSERKRLEATVERAERLSALGTMASGVAHNFNNILAAILGRVQLMLRYPEKIDTKTGLEIIQKAALDGAATVKRIQDFARTRVAGADFGSVNIHEIFDDIHEYACSRVQQRRDGGDPEVRVTAAMNTRCSVAGVASELREVLINLVNNALDAMPTGGTLTLETQREAERVLLIVEDSGQGMSKEIREQVFDPFFTTKGAKGMGLGLAESYGIIKRHKGVVHVESEVGKGTRFVVELPVGLVKLGAEEAAARALKTQAHGRILVVDDEASQASLLGEMLSSEGHEVVRAESGKEALEAFMRGGFDLVVTDISMAGMDGWEVARRVRKHQRAVGIVLVTGMEADYSESELEKAGVDRCLAKPVELDVLLRAINEVLIQYRRG
jgi:PAS domain S-box-containing protein